jgi:hypothetical protein
MKLIYRQILVIAFIGLNISIKAQNKVREIPADSIKNVQANDNDGRLIIQGGGTDESQIYINDLIVANPYTLASKNNGVRSRFNSDLFEGIVLQSGGFNAEFGQALSGIVNLNTKEKEQYGVGPIFRHRNAIPE